MSWTRLLPLLLVTVLAACAKVDADLTVAGDRVTGTILTALDRELVEALAVDPDDVFQEQVGILAALPGVTTGPYDDGTWVGTAYTFDQVALDDINQLAEDHLDRLRIVRDQVAGTYTLSLLVDLTWMAELDNNEDPAEGELDLAALADQLEMTIAVTFPGPVTATNGELTGTTVTWHPQPRERVELHAVALDPAADGSGAPGQATDGSNVLAVVLVVGLAVLVLAAAGVGTAWLVRRRTTPAPLPAIDDEPPTDPLPPRRS